MSELVQITFALNETNRLLREQVEVQQQLATAQTEITGQQRNILEKIAGHHTTLYGPDGRNGLCGDTRDLKKDMQEVKEAQEDCPARLMATQIPNKQAGQNNLISLIGLIVSGLAMVTTIVLGLRIPDEHKSPPPIVQPAHPTSP